MNENFLNEGPLNKKCGYISKYDKTLLFSIPREMQRKNMGISSEETPVNGFDTLNSYELSWLNDKGKPIVAIGCFVVPANSPCLIESKSLKLYLFSLNNTNFESVDKVAETIQKDLSEVAQADVRVEIFELEEYDVHINSGLPGECLDSLDVEIDAYNGNVDFLFTSNEVCEETLNSNLIKSNCLATGQPDWGSLLIHYKGHKIDRESLLKYIVSFRNHTEFHENCIERIFCDIMKKCKPQSLTVYGQYTRRGGVDINPLRTTETDVHPVYSRLVRQ